MRNSIYRITLDMHDVASQVQITAKQHDTARKLHITLSENGSPYTIEEGCRAVLSINRPGSTVINDDCEIKLNGSVIMYDFNSQTTEVLGINECEVKLYDPDGDIITSPRFTLLVDENVYNDGEDHGIDHRNVLNRDKEDQHPIKAITGLEKELESKANAEKIYAEIALDRSRIDNIAALGQNSVIEVQKKYNTTGDTSPLTFSLNNDGKCVVIIYYYKSAPNTETYSSSVLVNSQSIFTKTLDGAAGTYLEEVEFDGHSGDIVTITRDNVNVSINSVLYVTNKSTDTELADIRLGADGTIYPCAGDAVREQVSALKNDVDSQVGALKSDLDNIRSNRTGRVFFDELENGFIYWKTGAIVENESIKHTDFINVAGYKKIGVSRGNVQFAFYDSSKNYVSGILIATSGHDFELYGIPDDASYVRLSVDVNFTSKAYYTLSNDTLPFDDYVIIESNPNHCPDFSTLRGGIAFAIGYHNANVIVKRATYNLLEEFSTEISSSKVGQYGCGLGNGINIVAENGATINCLYDGTDKNVTTYLSPFYAISSGGGFTLENVEIHSSNCRYCVHDELNGIDVFVRNVYKNCRMYHDSTGGNEDIRNWYQACIGGGCGKQTYVDIDGCYFYTKFAETTNAIAVSYHNSNNNMALNSINVKNCYFAEKGTFRVTHYGDSQLKSIAILTGCSLGSAPIVKHEINGATTPNNFELISWNNEIRAN